MLDISSVNAISGILAAIGVIVGVVFAVLQLRDLVKTRQTDLVIRLYSTFTSKGFLETSLKLLTLDFKDYNDFLEKYGPIVSDTPVHVAITKVSNFFNEVGILLHRKLINIGLVSDLFTYRAAMIWEKMKPIIEGVRKELNQPEAGK